MEKNIHDILKKSDELIRQGGYENAIKLYDEALKVDSSNLDVLSGKAYALFVQNRNEEARECFNKALALKNDYDYILIYKGDELFHLGKYQEAVKCYNEALWLSWTDRERYQFVFTRLYNKSQAHWNLGQYKEAVASIDRIIELYPNDIFTEFNNKDNELSSILKSGLLMKCILYNELGQHQDAITLCDKLLEKQAGSGFLAIKGAALAGLRQYESALKWLNRCLAIEPYTAGALILKAIMLTKSGYYQEAIKHLDRALLNKDIEITKDRFIFNFTRSQIKDSISSINRLIEKDRNSEILIELIKRLQAILGPV